MKILTANKKLMKPPSGTLDVSLVRYPCWCSIKYDGFRTAILAGKTVLNSGRELDNLYTRKKLEAVKELEGHDGELVILPLNDGKTFNRCQSAFRAAAGEPDFHFIVFDQVAEGSFEDRWINFPKPAYPDWVIVDVPVLISNREELDAFTKKIVVDGHEGIIIRQGRTRYKNGRATFKSQEVLRIKPMETDEAEVVDFECEYENINEEEIDIHGYTKRSHSKEGLIPKDTLGKLICKHPKWGLLKISGFTDADADWIWQNQSKVLGQMVTFKYQAVGSIDKPRIPKFKGFRDLADIG